MYSPRHSALDTSTNQNRYKFLVRLLLGIWTFLLFFNRLLPDVWNLWIVVGVVPWIVWMSIECILGILVTKKIKTRSLKSVVLIVVTIFAFWGSGVTVIGPKITDRTSRELRILQWNTEFWGSQYDKGSSEVTFFGFLRSVDADIYILQEHGIPGPNDGIIGISNLDDVKENFPGYYIETSHDLITISKFPILEVKKDKNRGALSTLISSPGNPVKIINVHTVAPYKLSEPIWKKTFWREISDREELQNDQLTWVSNEARATDTPTIIAGDFNATENMRNLQRRYSGYRDLCASPWRGTWGVGGIMLWRLDWQLGNDLVNVSDSRILNKNSLSDHSPVLLQIHVSN